MVAYSGLTFTESAHFCKSPGCRCCTSEQSQPILILASICLGQLTGWRVAF